MKQIAVFLVCVAMITPAAFCDSDKIVTAKRIPYSGKLVGCEGYVVAIKLASRRTIKKNLADISQIVAEDNDALTEAEAAVKEKRYEEASALYDKALKNARTTWMKRLIGIRRFQALGKSEKIDKSVAEWIKRCDESPAAIELKIAPAGFAPKSSEANKRGIAALEKKIKTLEKNLDRNKAYITALLNLKMKIQEANENQDAVVFTVTQIEAVTAGQPRPTETPAKKPVAKPAAESAAAPAAATPDAPELELKTNVGWKNLDALEGLLKAGKAGKAGAVIEKIQAGLGKYDSKQLPSALLLLGKAQLQKFDADGKTDKKLPVAAGLNFMRVYACFGKAPQAPEALYLAGIANEIIGDDNAAERAMKKLVVEYSQTDPENEFVVKAKKKLTELDKN